MSFEFQMLCKDGYHVFDKRLFPNCSAALPSGHTSATVTTLGEEICLVLGEVAQIVTKLSFQFSVRSYLIVE